VSPPTGNSRGPLERTPGPADVTAVVPVRNAEQLLVGCLRALIDNGIGRIIVVDGESTDGSRKVAAEFGATVLRDGGAGLPHARSIGVSSAETRWVVLVDSDVVFPPGALSALLREFHVGKYAALQAGQLSVAGPGYWGQALARHHRTGRSRWWFGLLATVAERDLLIEHGFDDAFRSGEDIELRWRMASAGLKIGVSRGVFVEHRFAEDHFDFAKDQFLMDGTGLGLMIRKHGLRGTRLAALPLAAATRGAVLSLANREARWLRYYAAFCWYNYVGMVRGLAP
jgi:glycosyltransferase involved in cell wall biosynthesis